MMKIMEKSSMPFLEAEDISQGVLYVLGTPARVQVWTLIYEFLNRGSDFHFNRCTS
jgi:hypothetical protein